MTRQRTIRESAILLLVALTASLFPFAPPAWGDDAGGDGGAPSGAGSIDLERAGRYVAQFRETCEADGGAFWGRSLCVPLLFVDPATRDVVADRPDKEGVLRSAGGLFTGRLPADVAAANTAIEWGGVRWTMLIWQALSDDRAERTRLLAHEAFHNVQPGMGLDPGPLEMNRHLDDAEGRYWMRLEWRALRRALESPAPDRAGPVEDAILFREARRVRFPGSAERENALEVFEGIPEYTGCRFAGFTGAEVVDFSVRKQEGLDSYVRAFPYVSGPLYGYLLDNASPGWRDFVEARGDLARMLASAMHVTPAADPARAAAAAVPYGGEAIRSAEKERAARREAEIEEWRRKLVDGPALVVDLASVRSGSFNPNAVLPLSDHETVYVTRKLVADWGVLVVESGILEDDDAGVGRVSVAGGWRKGPPAEGEGWTLDLAPGWGIVPGERSGDFAVRAMDGGNGE